MDAVKYFEEKRRMEKSIRYDCEECELSAENNGKSLGCNNFELKHPEEAVAIVEKWSQEHPRKTMLSDLLEKYPKTPLVENGTPSFCPEDLGYCKELYCDRSDRDCVKCWNRPLEEGEQ